MKRSLFVLVFLMFSAACFSQILIGNDGTAKWVNLGTLSLAQGGNDCFIRIIGGSGYNAVWWQTGNIELHMRTGNWDSVDGNGFGFSATATCSGVSKFTAKIKIVPNSAGASATSYGIYVLLNDWPGGSFFTVEAPAGTFTSVLTSLATDPGGYDVPFAQYMSNDVLVNGNVGLGTFTPTARLTLGGGGNLNPNPGAEADYNGLNLTFKGESAGESHNLGSIKMVQPTGVYVDAADMTFSTSYGSLSEKMRITKEGKVGIGTTSPAAKLQLNVNANNYTVNEGLRIVNSYGPTGNNNPGIILTNDGSSADPLAGTNQTWALSASVAGAANFGISYKGGSSALITPFFIRGDGNIGIGTTNPTQTLSLQNATQPGIDLYTGIYNRASISATNALLTINSNTANPISFQVDASEKMRIDAAGNIAIGTTNPHGFKLAVAGKAIAESMTVQLQANWPDYVFEPSYSLRPLQEVKNYIDRNQHLPEVPSEKEVVKDGINLGEMNKVLLKKVEELTLYLIEQDKQNKEQQKINASQQQQIDQLKEQLSKLEGKK